MCILLVDTVQLYYIASHKNIKFYIFYIVTIYTLYLYAALFSIVCFI